MVTPIERLRRKDREVKLFFGYFFLIFRKIAEILIFREIEDFFMFRKAEIEEMKIIK